MPAIVKEKDGISLDLHIQPGASRAGFAGYHGESLKLRVTAQPIEGEANKAVIAFLAKFFGVPKGAVLIVRGETARKKLVKIVGDAEVLAARLNEDQGI